MADETPNWQTLSQPTDREQLEAEESKQKVADATERTNRAIDAIVAELRKLARLVDRDW